MAGDVASRFQNRAAGNAEEDEARSLIGEDMPLTEKIRSWLPNVDQSSKPIEQPGVDDEPAAGAGELDDDQSVDDLLPELAVYTKVITESSAYIWLLSMLRRQLLFAVPGDPSTCMAGISDAVFSHEAFRHVSRKLPRQPAA